MQGNNPQSGFYYKASQEMIDAAKAIEQVLQEPSFNPSIEGGASVKPYISQQTYMQKTQQQLKGSLD
jgi:hypothetical protein